MFFDNRVIATVSPFTQSNAVTGGGLHRPHRGMVVLDLDQSTMTAPDAQLSFRWNGLWTGPRPLQCLTASINGVNRGFVFSRDADGANRLYELNKTGGDDYVDGESKKIKSYFFTKRYDFSGTQETNKFWIKNINGGDMWVSGLSGVSQVKVSLRPDSYPCWTELLPEKEIGCTQCEVNAATCQIDVSQPRYKRIKFPTPLSECQQGSDQTTDFGSEFQLAVEMEGAVTVDRLRISADTRGNPEEPFGDCSDEPQDCTPIACCPIKDFDYYTFK